MSKIENQRQVGRLYQDTGWKKFFAQIRFWDSPYVEVEKIIPKSGQILELGCGEGVFSNYLAISSPKRKVIGVEIDKNRQKQAFRGLKNTKFIRGNALTVTPVRANVVVMFHLLHHLKSKQDQEVLIKRVYRSLNKGGLLVVVEIAQKPVIKFWVTWFVDHFVVPWLFEKRFYEPHIFFRTEKEWQAVLQQTGFRVKRIHCHDGKPFSHQLYICKK